MKKWLPISLAITLNQSVQAQFNLLEPVGAELSGHEFGNGGSIVVGGENYRLADLFFEPHPASGYTFDEELRRRMAELETNLSDWMMPNTKPFFADQINSDLVQYFFTDRLPEGCADVMEVPDDSTLQFACTQGFITWIIPKYFMKLSLEERVAAIIHERLHSYASEQPHQVIAPFIKGLVLFQMIAAEQQQFSLSAEQWEVLKLMRFSARQLGLIPKNDGFTVFANGAGLVGPESVIDPSAYIDFRSSVIASELGPRAYLFQSRVKNATIGSDSHVQSSLIGMKEAFRGPNPPNGKDRDFIASGCVVQSSKLYSSIMPENCRVTDSSLENTVFVNQSVISKVLASNIRFEGDSFVEASRFAAINDIRDGRLSVRSGVFTHSRIYVGSHREGLFDKDPEIRDSILRFEMQSKPQIQIQENVKISESVAVFNRDTMIGAGARIHNSILNAQVGEADLPIKDHIGELNYYLEVHPYNTPGAYRIGKDVQIIDSKILAPNLELQAGEIISGIILE